MFPKEIELPGIINDVLASMQLHQLETTTWNNAYVKISFLVMALLVPAGVSALWKSSHPRVPIPLANEIRQRKKRAEAYCYQSRSVLQKGYEQVCFLGPPRGFAFSVNHSTPSVQGQTIRCRYYGWYGKTSLTKSNLIIWPRTN